MFVQHYIDVKTGAADIAVDSTLVKASPHKLVAALFERTKTDAIDLFLEVVGGSRVFVIDSITTFTGTSYCFPNTRVPEPIAVAPGFYFRLRTTGTVALDENQSAVLFVAETTY